MFNLAHIYFYEEAGICKIEEAIELLIKSTLQNIEYSINLLCLTVVKKYESLKESEIIQKFENY